MGVLVRPLSQLGGRITFQGWNNTFTNTGLVSAGKNRVDAAADTLLNRYAGIRVPGTSVNLLESSTKAAPNVWAVPNVLPAAATGIRVLYALPNVTPDTLLVGVENAAQLYKWVDGAGFTSLAYPAAGASLAVVSVAPTSNPDVFLVGNQSTGANPSTIRQLTLSSATWSAALFTGVFSGTNSTVNIVIRGNLAYAIDGGGSANGLNVYRSPSPFTVWTQIGGAGLFGSWPAANHRNGFLAFGGNGKLYAGIGGVATFAEAWECSSPDTAPSWRMIGDNSQWTSATISNASHVTALANKIVFGTAGSVAGDAQTWQYDTQVGLNSWQQLAVGAFSRTGVGTLYVSPFNNELFTGVGNNAVGTANLYEVTGGRLSNNGGGMQFQLYKVRV